MTIGLNWVLLVLLVLNQQLGFIFLLCITLEVRSITVSSDC